MKNVLRDKGKGDLVDWIEGYPKKIKMADGTTEIRELKTASVHDMMGKSPETNEIYRLAGIDGFKAADYYCFFPHAEMGEFRIKDAVNISREEARAQLTALQEKRRSTEVETSLDQARQDKTAHIKEHWGTAAIGIKQDGTAYSVYDPDEDHNKNTAQDRVSLRFGQDQNGKMVVSHIERDGARANLAFKAQTISSSDPADQARIADRVFRPQKVEIAGVQFEVGGPAEGRIANDADFAKPDSQAALARMSENYQMATFKRIDFGKPDHLPTTSPNAATTAQQQRALPAMHR